ncbi:TonB-dependent receptor, partial [Achromobacter xylosoxidans]|uniref:TonB-dependent receptor domain-containing protein n=1 Tax=Alcaligenes xylosoxydans xylosoxydans TaxID=85698 RepID=UPI001F0F7F6F
DVVAGLEFLKEEQNTQTLSAQIPGQAAPSTVANLYRPNRYDAVPAVVPNGGYTHGETDTAAAYLFDTLKFGERFQLNGVVRIDYYDTNYDALSVNTNSPTLAVTRTQTDLGAHDTLFSWKLGGLYKPTTYSSVYASYAKSLTPPG